MKSYLFVVLELQLLWARPWDSYLIYSIGITAFVRTESNTSVDAAYVRMTTHGRSYSAVWDT
jgi:hypothetical protein